MNLARRNWTIGVVDDDPAVARIVETYLQKDFGDDAKIIVMTDPSAAKQWLDEISCDLLISDIEMPGIDGMELLRIAKARNAWTQVVFMTAHSTIDRLAEAIERGASDYLIKPIDREELINVVGQEQRRMMRWKSALLGTLRHARA